MLIQLILAIVLVGLLLYVIEHFIPMDATIRMILRVVIGIALIIWILNVFGVLTRGALP